MSSHRSLLGQKRPAYEVLMRSLWGLVKRPAYVVAQVSFGPKETCVWGLYEVSMRSRKETCICRIIYTHKYTHNTGLFWAKRDLCRDLRMRSLWGLYEVSWKEPYIWVVKRALYMSEFQVVFVDNQQTYKCICTYASYLRSRAGLCAVDLMRLCTHTHIYVCWLWTNTTWNSLIYRALSTFSMRCSAF